MSFGDPNNPYGQQPQAPQGQPGYGYPQQTPQGVPAQAGYGYPQGTPGGGYPGTPLTMPGGVTASRVLLFVIATLQIIGAGIFMVAGAAVQKLKDDPTVQADAQFEQLQDFPTGALYAFAVLILAWGILAIVLGVKFGKGGNGIRVTTIVFASITAIAGIWPFVGIGLLHTILAILIIVFVAKSDGAAWFNRQR
ncbi:hypothetical protein ACWGHM_12295 [Streptomyces sp. NPDC054904]|uniref:hypothetical protein n=1 Tax=unclassified Streptomyces TaxID=2593676 RepID=UPI002481B157|nr:MULTISPECIES: hypothetical protein [unclassified Streptomyces]MDA5285206.1 hypothetical protein [Streptomyces sp. Isolate_45]MDX2389585.1 hypothetical protein [Streptomyces sp. DK15]